LSACDLGKLKIWDIVQKDLISEVKLDEKFAIKCITSTIDGQVIFAGDVKGNIKQFL